MADKKRKEEAELRNQADQTVFSTKKQLEDLGDKLPAEGKAKIEAATEKLEGALKSGTMDEIRSAKEALDKTWSEGSQQMYQSQPGAGPEAAGTDGTASAGGDNVEEADYTIVDDDDKK